MRIFGLMWWSIKLDYTFLVKVPDIPLGEKIWVIVLKYLVYIKNKLFGFRTGLSNVTVFKRKFYYGDVYGIASLQRVYCEHYVLKKYLDGSPIVIDVGANIGQFNLFCKHYLQAERVVSIEPLPDCFELLKLNAVAPEDCLSAIISTDTAMRTLYVAGNSGALSTYIKDAREAYERKLVIRSIKLDDAGDVGSLQRVDLLKIDTEGSEFDVLVSAEKSLNHISLITIEMSVLRSASGSFFAMGAFLEKRGFELVSLSPHRGFYPFGIEGIFKRG